MAKTNGLNQSVHFKAWMVLLVGMALGVLGYFFFQNASAAGLKLPGVSNTPKIGAGECVEAGGSVVNGGGSYCIGGGFDGERITGP